MKSFGEKRQVKVSILIDNSLHGKIYICKRSNIYTSAIITSANFTQKGLKKTMNGEFPFLILMI
ncbi:restriction endonuclease PLD domain-containing protein [Bacteroides faecis]|uniref:restriction endonuclease PLD domain-containing protein n=1 Tax=Bacteroides faecis TaxID=674529 RepID=UPI0035B51FBD